MKTFVAVLLLVGSPVAARAQPGLTDPTPAPSPSPDDGGDRSPGVALGLSLAGTAAGYGALLAAVQADSEALGWVAFGGMIVGPSLGHFYSGEVGRGLGHSGIRLGAAGIIVIGGAIAFSDCFFTEEEQCDGSAGPLIMLGGAVLGVGSTVYSIVDAPRAASRANASRPRLVITPAPVVGPERSTGFGLQVGSSF
ncbi:MAG TPA: hypothetical protein VFU21_13120 [Kofleriaceae bacterium]|nr:hypothetical protein [Kofleriaceae bacterium]